MARIDDLPADQQAVLRLLLTQDRSYDEIARSLRMAPAAVRDRAHEALSALGPSDTPLSASRRAELTDWLLGQQGAAEARRTEDAVADSPAALAWARVVSGELKPVAEPGRLPEVPAGGGGASALVDDDGASPAAERARSRAEARQDARPASRRGGAILLGVAGLLVAAALGFVLGRVTKGDDAKPASTTARQGQVKSLGQANLAPLPALKGSGAKGIAVFLEGGGQRGMQAQAVKLPRTPSGGGYGVWLSGAGKKPVWLGYFPNSQRGGTLQAVAVLKVNPRDYRTVLVTRENGKTPTTPGTTVLSGPIRLRSS